MQKAANTNDPQAPEQDEGGSDAARPESGPAPHSDIAPRPSLYKATLLGLSPLTPHGAPMLVSVPTQPGAAKPTLLGMGQGAGPAVRPAPLPRRPSLADADQRTIQGFPMATPGPAAAVTLSPGASTAIPSRRDTQRGVVSAQPGMEPGAVSHTRMKPISEPAPAASLNELRFTAFEPQASQEHTAPVAPHPVASAPRAVASAPNRTRSSRAFRYALICVLTLASYVGWLYLLDLL